MKLSTVYAVATAVLATGTTANPLDLKARADGYVPRPMDETIQVLGLEEYVRDLPPVDPLTKRDTVRNCQNAVCTCIFFVYLLEHTSVSTLQLP